jgi:hypothetical protein
MKLDPGMHIVMHLVFFGKTGVTEAGARCPCRRLGGQGAAAQPRKPPRGTKRGTPRGQPGRADEWLSRP